MEKPARNPFGGRRRADSRYLDTDMAGQITDLLRVVRAATDLPNGAIANQMGYSGSTLSRAVGGRAGEETMQQIKTHLEMIVANS